jgi:hypothetical protein
LEATTLPFGAQEKSTYFATNCRDSIVSLPSETEGWECSF